MNEDNNFKFKPWQGIYLCFYDKNFYREAVKKWHGFGFGFFAYATLVNMFLVVATLCVVFNQFINLMVIPGLQNMPDFKLANQTLEFKSDKPFQVKIPGLDTVFLYIDPKSDKYNYEIASVIQLCPHKYYVSRQDKNNFEIQTTKPGIITQVSEYPQAYHITKSEAINFVLMSVWFIPLLFIIYPLNLGFGIIGLFIQGGILNLFASLSTLNLTYQEIVRALVIAGTPNMVLSPIFILVKLFFHYGFLDLLSFAIWLIYLTLILKAQKETDSSFKVNESV